jgi:hypothetical protein
MLFFNALIKLQAVMFGLAALAGPEPPAAELEYDDGLFESSDPAFDLTDEARPTEAARWECWDRDEYKRRGYCLARCEDSLSYRRVTDRIRVRGNRDFCQKKARQYCRGRNDRLDRACFGERDWDDDDNGDGWGR